jgi:hypothetical protein
MTASDGSSVERFERALWQFQTYFGDPIATVEAALQTDPELVLGHVLRAAVLPALAERRFQDQVRASVVAAEALLPRPNDRERALVASMRLIVDGDWDSGCRALDHVLVDNPRDALALQTAHLFDFYRGDALNLRNRVARVLPAWSPSVPGYSYVLGRYAFGLEESNQYQAAEATGRRALELEPKDPWAVHAVTHVFEMQGRVEEGVDWLTSREPDWAPDNGFAYHKLWHLFTSTGNGTTRASRSTTRAFIRAHPRRPCSSSTQRRSSGGSGWRAWTAVSAPGPSPTTGPEGWKPSAASTPSTTFTR